MKHLWILMQQDFKLILRNALFYVLVGLEVIFIALVIFLPENVDYAAPEYFYDASENKVLENALLHLGMDDENIYDSYEEMVTAIQDGKKGIGITFSGDIENPQFDILSYGPVAEENLNLLEATLDTVIEYLQGGQPVENFEINLLRPKSDPVPLNRNLIPIFVVFEAVTLGFMIVAVLIFSEKEEGAIRAIRVSPVTTLQYILSKTILFSLLGLIYGGILVVVGVGFSINYLNLIIIMFLGSFLMTLMGLLIAVFFRNLSEWMMVGVMVLLVNMLPSISYGFPAFTPFWISWIPSYNMVFTVREILFSTGKTGFMLPAVINIVIWIIIFGIAAYIAVDRKLMKDG